jgi:hypothetical protein
VDIPRHQLDRSAMNENQSSSDGGGGCFYELLAVNKK